MYYGTTAKDDVQFNTHMYFSFIREEGDKIPLQSSAKIFPKLVHVSFLQTHRHYVCERVY